jgi:hypothetical protein
MLAMSRHCASSAQRKQKPSRTHLMFRAIGFVIGLIAIRVIMPEVFHAFEHFAITFFQLAGHIFDYPPQSVTQMAGIGYTNYVPQTASLPVTLR